MMTGVSISFLLFAGLLGQQSVTGQEIAIEAQRALEQALSEEGSRATVSIETKLRDQSVPAGEVAILTTVPAGRFPRSRMSIPVRILVDGIPARSLWVNASFDEPRQVYVYARPYPTRQPGEGVEWMPQTINATCCAGPFIENARELKGLRLKRSVPVGSPMVRSDFEPIPPVRVGELVNIQVNNGSVQLNVKGRALADAQLGERVNVLAIGAARPVRALVEGPSKVSVHEKN